MDINCGLKLTETRNEMKYTTVNKGNTKTNTNCADINNQRVEKTTERTVQELT